MKKLLHVLAIALAVIAADQWSKWYMLTTVDIAGRAPIEVTGFFRLVMVWNQGISFGMLNGGHGMPLLLIGIAVAIAAVLARLATRSELPLERFGYGMVIGGALGNVIDRLRFGAVADFFYFHLGERGWPAFNAADSAICVGVGILLLVMLRHPKRA